MSEFLNAADPGLILPAGRSYWTSPDMYDYATTNPAYLRREASMLFFGRSTRWFKAHVYERNPEILADLTGLVHTDPRGRRFKLFHIEYIANELAARHVIDGRQFMWSIATLRLQACLWGYSEQIEQLSREAGHGNL